MPAQIVVSDDILGQRLPDLDLPAATFWWHSFNEIIDLAAAARDRDRSLVVFTERSATARALNHLLTKAHQLRSQVLAEDVDPDTRSDILRNKLAAGNLDVVMCTRAMSTGWRAPARVEAVLHAELPPYGFGFLPQMLQRQARIGSRAEL